MGKRSLEGFLWSHQSIKLLIHPRHFALKDWFLANEHFPSCSFWICHPIPWCLKFQFLWRHTSLLCAMQKWWTSPTDILYLLGMETKSMPVDGCMLKSRFDWKIRCKCHNPTHSPHSTYYSLVLLSGLFVPELTSHNQPWISLPTTTKDSFY